MSQQQTEAEQPPSSGEEALALAEIRVRVAELKQDIFNGEHGPSEPLRVRIQQYRIWDEALALMLDPTAKPAARRHVIEMNRSACKCEEGYERLHQLLEGHSRLLAKFETKDF